MTEGARPATEADVGVIETLFRAATEELRAERGGALWARERNRDAGFVPPEGGLVLAGTVDDVVVGYAVVRIERFADGGELAVLDDVYVEPGAREVGVGEALLRDAVEWAQARGCVGIDSTALPGMRATKNFFEAAGLTARAITVHRRL